jgi:hypothetical protein
MCAFSESFRIFVTRIVVREKMILRLFFILFAALGSSQVRGAEIHACDLLELAAATALLGQPITHGPSRNQFPPTETFTKGTSCFYWGGERPSLEVSMFEHVSVAAAQHEMARSHALTHKEPELEYSEDKGVGDQAQWLYRKSENRIFFMARKGNILVVITAGGSSLFVVSPALRARIRQEMIGALKKI